ncbi:threonine dehydrogenase-like Zn-dependent dehydrogenase [Rhizobium azooxidifex]|uniref:Threonine dehydrogenase-like Zn-dependent dehydrogenase n=1 Tax=Mycoplana azooxidifex TaxID=1636188 RepID=A0A7W6DHC9_9HYPH|nr:threonine dehydrogenase-like Zn-dependent dehydrogenase [Mycoplana azooxidifex]
MKALTWHGSGDIRCEAVDDPIIQDDRDAIIKVTSCAICGSDLHLYGGFVPGMHAGDVMGHETMGEVVEVGRRNAKLKVGDRVVVPFTISCGECRMCKWSLFSLCERSNPSGAEQAKQIGYPTAGVRNRSFASLWIGFQTPKAVILVTGTCEIETATALFIPALRAYAVCAHPGNIKHAIGGLSAGRALQ